MIGKDIVCLNRAFKANLEETVRLGKGIDRQVMGSTRFSLFTC